MSDLPEAADRQLSNLESDLRHLYHLLDTLCEQAFGDGDQDRCNALAWIARDVAKKCRDDAHLIIWPGCPPQ